MLNGYSSDFTFTSNDLTQKNGKYYLVFSTTDDYKAKAMKYTLTAGDTGGGNTGGESGNTGGETPATSDDLHFWFFNASDAATNNVTNDATVFSGMVSSGSNLTGTITIDGTNYSVTRRTGDNATFGSFTIPANYTANFYALAVSSGDGARQINLVCGSNKYEMAVAGGSSAYKQIEYQNLPAGTYSIEREGSNNVRLGVVVLKFISSGGGETTTPVTGVTLDKSSISIVQGTTEQLTATVAPDDATDPSVTWSSSDASVATVNNNGLVSAIGAGNATITVTTTDGGKTATCTVTVSAPSTIIPVTGISIKSSTTLSIGSTETLTVTYTPSDANTGKAITWSSSNEAVATVDASGKVTGVAAGTATITATSEGGVATASCTVTVQAIAVTGVTLNKTTITINKGATETLTATVSPSNATNQAVTWSSSNAAVATVTNGIVTGVAAGNATITVTTVDGSKTTSCAVTVEEQQVPPTPASGLTAHTPEIYEDPAGYNTALSTYGGREYEVYYICRDGTGNNIAVATVPVDKATTAITTGTATTTKAKDNWFELKASGGKGGDSNASAKDEFKYGSLQCVKMQGGQEMEFKVKGFDQFNFYGKDNNKDATKGKQFEVYIDDSKVSGTPIDGYAIHRYQMTTAEHVIRLVGIGESDSKLTGFSLRVSNDPLVRHLNGKKDQNVYQTKDIERVAFRVRRAASHRLTWIGNAIPGVSLIDGTNDSVFVEGIADAAAGTYTYRIEALDGTASVASFETGTITISTHVFDGRNGNDLTTNLGEAIKPLQFIYYAANSSDITLQWTNGTVEGLSLSYQRDSIAILSGTPSAQNAGGTYPYTIVAAGGNTISGVITLLVPDPAFEAVPVAKIKDGKPLVFTVKALHASNITASGLPSWITYAYDNATGIATFSGTPNVGSPYPKEYPYTLTATPAYAGKQEVSASSKIQVIDPAMRTIMVAHKNLTDVSDDKTALYLQSKNYDITLRSQDELEGSSMEAFDLILISENVDADHHAVLSLIKSAPKPVLNMKAFTYIYERDEDTPTGWGEPDNGSLSDNGRYITIQRDDHPIFRQMNKKRGDRMEILSRASTEAPVNKKGLMPINIFRQGTYCLATALTRDKGNYYGDGEMQTFLHEEPAALRGGNKYICMPIARTGSEHLAVDGKKLIEAVVNYLLSDDATVTRVPLQITSFSIDGVQGVIEEDGTEGTIEVAIDKATHPNIDLRQVAPQVTVASEYTHVVPLSGDTIDAYWSSFNAVPYVVTDYINRFVYNVTVTTFDSQDIESVYTAGEWVNIFDIYGRKIATTNEDIHTMTLPRGVYIVVTENGYSMKIMR